MSKEKYIHTTSFSREVESRATDSLALQKLRKGEKGGKTKMRTALNSTNTSAISTPQKPPAPNHPLTHSDLEPPSTPGPDAATSRPSRTSPPKICLFLAAPPPKRPNSSRVARRHRAGVSTPSQCGLHWLPVSWPQADVLPKTPITPFSSLFEKMP